MLDEKIPHLKARLVSFATLVESMLQKSMDAIVKTEREELLEVVTADEPRANDFELDVDEQCTALIAQFQPKATNLRTVMMIARISNDLERLGDIAVNISQSGLFLIERVKLQEIFDILVPMHEETIRMMRDSITSFIKRDTVQAKNVCERDSLVDDFRDQVVVKAVEIMRSQRNNIEECLHLIRIANNLERAADLSTNISEDVLYMVEGRVIKHHHEEEQS